MAFFVEYTTQTGGQPTIRKHVMRAYTVFSDSRPVASGDSPQGRRASARVIIKDDLKNYEYRIKIVNFEKNALTKNRCFVDFQIEINVYADDAHPGLNRINQTEPNA